MCVYITAHCHSCTSSNTIGELNHDRGVVARNMWSIQDILHVFVPLMKLYEMYSKYVTREYLILFTYRNSIFIYLLTGIKAIILKSISVWKSLRIDDLCNETHLNREKEETFPR